MCGEQVTSELLRSQIEIGTKVCNNVQEARDDLAVCVRNIIDVANDMVSRRSLRRRIRFPAGRSKNRRQKIVTSR